MTKKEITLVALGFTAAAVLAGGFFVWHHHNSKLSVKANATQTTGDHVISLDQSNNGDEGGLQVKGDGATDLGQLGGNSGSSSGGSSSGGSSSQADFSKYDKYKSNSSALFGEVQAGTGAELKAGNKAYIAYMGWLTDGTVFDQSKTGSDGQPQTFNFTLGAHQVIPGLEQGMAGMKVGGTRLVIVPPSVGYGAQGQGSVPANAVMIFQIKLVDVK
jgi:FKBP-type peptidyl-prolyl cis-trans isomerase FkpA